MRRDDHTLPGPLLAIFAVGAVLALGGGLWDDAWHTERGRDSFFIAPHLAIYGGVTLVGGGIALWLLLVARARGWSEAVRTPAALLGATSVAITLASAPVDNFWHVAFGRDAVIWSPPHLLGIVGTGSLGVAVLVDLAHADAPWARLARGAVGGLMLAAFAFVVVEYETDVPQFDVRWYLPVLALAAGFVFAIVGRVEDEARWPTLTAAAWHLGFVAAIGALLRADGFSAPRLPLLVLPAVVFDLLRRRRAHPLVIAAATASALVAAYVPASHVGNGARLGGGDAVFALLLGVPALLAPSLALGRAGRRPLRGAAVAAALLGVLAFPAAASAHDPGQGPSAGTLSLRVATHGRRAIVSVAARPGLSPLGIVARRAGAAHRGRLRRGPGGRFTGAVELGEPGRWFVYVDLRRADGKTVESWLPVQSGTDGTVTDPRRFAYVDDRKPSSAVKWVVGGVVYALVLAFLAAIVVLVRRTAAPAARPSYGP